MSRHHEIGWSVPPVVVPSPAAASAACASARPCGRCRSAASASGTRRPVRLSSSGRSRVAGMHAVADVERLRRRPGRARRGRAARRSGRRSSAGARLGLGRRADADEAAAALHVVGERALLLAVEPVAGRVQEHDRAVAREVRAGEVRRAGSSPSTWKPPCAPRSLIAAMPALTSGMPCRARMEHEHLRCLRVRLGGARERDDRRHAERVQPPRARIPCCLPSSRCDAENFPCGVPPSDQPKFHLSRDLSTNCSDDDTRKAYASRCDAAGNRQGGRSHAAPMRHRMALRGAHQRS